jgi:hypothetical protein
MNDQQLAAWLERYPPVTAPRIVYVQGLPGREKLLLMERGYRPTELNSLPRSTPQENVEYLRAKCQALEERTIDSTPEDRKRLELEMRSYGLLDHRSVKMTLNANIDTAEVATLLGWGSSRHTLRENSTALAALLPTPQKEADDDD